MKRIERARPRVPRVAASSKGRRSGALSCGPVDFAVPVRSSELDPPRPRRRSAPRRRLSFFGPSGARGGRSRSSFTNARGVTSATRETFEPARGTRPASSPRRSPLGGLERLPRAGEQSPRRPAVSRRRREAGVGEAASVASRRRSSATSRGGPSRRAGPWPLLRRGSLEGGREGGKAPCSSRRAPHEGVADDLVRDADRRRLRTRLAAVSVKRPVAEALFAGSGRRSRPPRRRSTRREAARSPRRLEGFSRGRRAARRRDEERDRPPLRARRAKTGRRSPSGALRAPRLGGSSSLRRTGTAKIHPAPTTTPPERRPFSSWRATSPERAGLARSILFIAFAAEEEGRSARSSSRRTRRFRWRASPRCSTWT